MFGDDQRDGPLSAISLTTEVTIVAELLRLTPHPEGGWFRRVWTAATPAGNSAHRAAASAILFLLAHGEGSAWHRLHTSEEWWLWRAGQPLLLHTGGAGEYPAAEHVHDLSDSATGLSGVVIPRQHWQRASVACAGWTLVTCVVCPEFDFADFELA